MTDGNILRADFTGGKRRVMATGLWQWDYGQLLKFIGLPDPPSTVEVHFAQGGQSKTMIGTTEEGVLSVDIPDAMLTESKLLTAMIVLHVAEEDGETEFRVYMPVRPRAQPETYDEDDPELQAAYTALVRATELLTDGMQQVADDVQAADAAAARAEAAAEEAEAGVTDYTLMQNKPKIESVILEGNKTFTDFGHGPIADADILAL